MDIEITPSGRATVKPFPTEPPAELQAQDDYEHVIVAYEDLTPTQCRHILDASPVGQEDLNTVTQTIRRDIRDGRPLAEILEEAEVLVGEYKNMGDNLIVTYSKWYLVEKWGVADLGEAWEVDQRFVLYLKEAKKPSERGVNLNIDPEAHVLPEPDHDALTPRELAMLDALRNSQHINCTLADNAKVATQTQADVVAMIRQLGGEN